MHTVLSCERYDDHVATALLQHGIPYILPLKIARFYIVSSATCLMCEYARIINFRIIIIIIILYSRVYNARGLKTERIKTAEMTRGPECHQ